MRGAGAYGSTATARARWRVPSHHRTGADEHLYTMCCAWIVREQTEQMCVIAEMYVAWNVKGRASGMERGGFPGGARMQTLSLFVLLMLPVSGNVIGSLAALPCRMQVEQLQIYWVSL